MRLEELDYTLPREQIAQFPLPNRAASRLLLFERSSGRFEDRQFVEFPDLLRGDELLIVNNARVIPARLYGRRVGVHSDAPSKATRREHLSALIEVFLVRQLEDDVWEALVRPGRKMKTGERVVFGEGELEGEVLARGEYGQRTLRFRAGGGGTVAEQIERLGHIPLPPYIDRADEAADRERYQTVFARRPGAVAAPTAGLHFTPEIIERIRARGAELRELTLQVGLGTFQPIHAETLEGHRMHAERYEIPEETAEKIREAQASGRRVVAIGTTAVRALEAAAERAERGEGGPLLCAGAGEASLFITPGYQFRVVDALLTNFHLPRSTLLALVCALGGRERVLGAYRHAVEAGYRFYSYGDCMYLR